MTLMQGYLIGAAYMGVLMAACARDISKGPRSFIAALLVMATWPIAPLFVLLERKLRERGSI